MAIGHQLYYYSLLGVFLVVAYMMYVDPNVGQFIILLWKMVKVQYHRTVFWIRFYPRLRYDTFILKLRGRRAMKNLSRNAKSNDPG